MLKQLTGPIILMATALLLHSLASHAAQDPQASISISSQAVEVTASDREIYLRIGGPDGFFRELRGRDFVGWTPDSATADGTYHYDCYVSYSVPRDGSISEEAMEEVLEAASSSSHGIFNIENGLLLENGEAPAETPDDTRLPDPLGMLKPFGDSPENNFWSAIDGLLNVLVPPAQAVNTINDDVQINGYLYVVGSGGYLNYNDTTSDLYLTGGSYYLLDNAPKFFVYDESTTDYNWYFDFNDASFKLVDTVGANVNNAISITAQSGTTNSNNSFVVDTLGDIGLADNAVFIDRSADEVGIGTLSPAGSLHILDDALPELILEDSGAGSTRWELEASTAELHVYGYNSTSFTSYYPFRINNNAKSNTLALGNITESTGNVGIGTNDPQARVHILGYDGTARIQIEEKNVTVQERPLLRMINNGGGRIDWINTASGTTWKMNANNLDYFVISQLGVPNSGKLFLNGASDVMKLGLGIGPQYPLHHSSGARLTYGGVWTNASSRSLKKDIHELDADAAMEALQELKPVTYRYKNDDNEDYVGFIAEEVPELVAENDRQTLSPMDFVAVLTKVVQEQNKALQQQEQTIEMQREAMTALTERLVRLEEIIKQP